MVIKVNPMRRNWPQPLWLHLGSAWSCLSNAVNAWMTLPSKSVTWTPDRAKQLAQLQKQLQQSGLAPDKVAHAIATQAAQDWKHVLGGLWLYQNHPVQRIEPDWTMIATHGATALKLRKTTTKKQKTPIVIIPSLINRYHILDLHPDHSFVQSLCDAGHDVYLVDWHHDLKKKLPVSLDDAITHHMLPLLKKMPKHYHMMGYCMGGTMAIATACLSPKSIQSLTLIATPWDFHAPDRRAAQEFANRMNDPRLTDTNSASLLQMMFWQRDPLAALSKFRRFAQRDANDPLNPVFVLAEDWLNDGVALPVSLLRDCAQKWYTDNATMRKKWIVSDTKISLSTLKHIPTQSITAQRDSLVLPQSSFALHNETLLFETGHIGLFAGSLSKKTIWPQMQHFLARHNTR